MSKTLSNNNTKSSLLAAFTSPVKAQKEQAASSSKKQLKATNSTESVCSCSTSEQGDDLYLQEQQQQVYQQQQGEWVSPYATFTQDIQGPTFIPVFASVESILPHQNNTHRGQVPWKCCNCEAQAFGHCCCNCRKNRDAAALRVFMGQLSREGDVELVSKMIQVLCPEVDLSRHLFHIEPHTAANTARGKGCAWAYVDSLDHLLYICKRLHKRTYPTVNTQTGEVGFVAFPDTFAEADIKACFDNDMSFLPESVQALFHRSPITAEVPKSLQQILNLPQNASNVSMSVYQQQRQQQIAQKQKFFFEKQQQQQQAQQQNQSAGVIMKPSAYTAPSQRVQQQQQQQQEQQQVQQQHANHNTNNGKKMLNRFHWNPYSPSSTRTQCA